ncbi:unnamed protein product [Parnassius apollo]|uniref:(apollo) hypothetical protein n=1 Tax=Parnassius apollo TaxID=110799 RepID=A0A8S3XK21_PARAO|nr:unnamed protein product [Parnassius apollo]
MENIMSESLRDIAMDFKLLLSEMKAIRAEMRLFHNSMTDLMTAIKMQSSRIDSIETRISALEDKSKCLQRYEVSTLEEKVSQLKSQILERDQDLFANYIQIAGFTDTSGENTADIILATAKKLCVDLDEHDVVSSERTVECCRTSFVINPMKTYQAVEGFGGAVTAEMQQLSTGRVCHE